MVHEPIHWSIYASFFLSHAGAIVALGCYLTFMRNEQLFYLTDYWQSYSHLGSRKVQTVQLTHRLLVFHENILAVSVYRTYLSCVKKNGFQKVYLLTVLVTTPQLCHYMIMCSCAWTVIKRSVCLRGVSSRQRHSLRVHLVSPFVSRFNRMQLCLRNA